MPTSTILIVDDEPANLALLTQILLPHFQVRAANSGEHALRVVEIEPMPDLILLDVMMASLDGYGVLARLRDNPATRAIPVIFVTALDDEVNEEQGLLLGAVDYISKPIKPAIVLARVRAQMELKQARDILQGHNDWLEAEVIRRTEEILLIQDVGIHALAELAETRDPETGNHIRRTQEYVATLADQLSGHPRFKDRLDRHAIQLLVKSAPLHDIGKVGIPDAILLKPGPLTAEEWAIMKTHALLGANAIEKAVRDTGKPVDFLAVASEIAHWHHEKWDGSGYPDGMSGDAIPVSARLMALADVFDALVSHRVYKSALPPAQARDIIVEGRGRHFDPDVVDAFSARYGQFASIAAQFADPAA